MRALTPQEAVEADLKVALDQLHQAAEIFYRFCLGEPLELLADR